MRASNSAGLECFPYKEEVTGSNPVSPTTVKIRAFGPPLKENGALRAHSKLNAFSFRGGSFITMGR